MVDRSVAPASSASTRRRRHPWRTVCAAGVLALAASAASIGSAAPGGTSTTAGSRPSPSSTGLPIFFFGTFTDPRWSGSIELVVSSDGTTVSVNGIAPGMCADDDFGPLVAGKDGAAGAVFASYQYAKIQPNGRFSARERRAGQRRPFKPLQTVVVSGTFSGNTVRGRLQARTTSTFDDCTGGGAFVARRRVG
jgi:hypothetical protein